MSLPQEILDAYHTSMGEDFVGLPKMPKTIAEARVVELQAELASVEDDDQRVATLNREIEETQEILDTANYSETDGDIAYWNSYRQGLITFLQNL